MPRNTIAAACAAIALALAPAVHAETLHSQRSAAMTNEMTTDEIRASKFIGSAVYDVHNQKIGSVNELLFDRMGRIDKAVLDVGAFLGMGGKLVAVNLSDMKTDNNRLTLDMTKDQLKAAQEFRFRDTESTGSSVPQTERSAHPTRDR
jgi:hypothetical protein